MVNLYDLLDLVYDATKLDITARNEKTTYLHRWLIGDYPVKLPSGLWRDELDGKLSVVRVNINHHGEPRGKSKQPEMAWGVDTKKLPKEFLVAKVTSLHIGSMGRGRELKVDIELSEMEAEMLKALSHCVEVE